MKVNIPNDEDLKNNVNFEYITVNSGDSAQDEYDTEGYYLNGSESNLNTSDNNEVKNNIVNINTATQTELESLPGIGPSLALRIINYRKENGKFSSVEEIMNVSGIGEARFEALKKYIIV